MAATDTAARMTAWAGTHDPGLLALRRAARVTVAACTGFLVCRYLLGTPVTATYAVFGAIALGMLSDVAGPPDRRTRTYLAALPAALVLATVGTLVAGSTGAAVVGMLVVGFLVAYSGVGGPRVAGLANGLQLCYILPCFPPQDVAALPDRLAGLAVGVVLVALADRLLWPAPAPGSFAERVAAAAVVVAEHVAAVAAGLHPDRPVENPDGPRDAALAAVAALRPSAVPVALRPMGPGLRDRGLTHAASAVRIVAVRTEVLSGLVTGPHDPAATEATAALLGSVARTLTASAAALRGSGPAPEAGPLEADIAHYLDRRAERMGRRTGATDLPPVLRAGVAAAAVAEAGRGLVAATRAATGRPPDPTADAPPAAWYVGVPAASLWWLRLRGHLTPRSVYLQNALRLALGLAAARLVTDVLDLSHGLWVLLATLGLMRTSLVASGLAIVPAFLGTVGGAVVAAGVLTAVGNDPLVYAVALPVIMVLAFAAGPALGPAAGQFGFTVVVSVLFAQLAPATWTLAGTRLLDVVVGGVVGALIGAAVWPRGGAAEVRRAAAACLRAAADDMTSTVAALTGEPAPSAGPSRHVAILFDATYAQYRTEPGGRAATQDWMEVLGVVHRVFSDAETLRARYPAPGPLPWPPVERTLAFATGRVAGAYRDAGVRVHEGGDPQPTRGLVARLDADPPHAPFSDDPRAAVRVVDVWSWLHGLAQDLARAERAVGR